MFICNFSLNLLISVDFSTEIGLYLANIHALGIETLVTCKSRSMVLLSFVPIQHFSDFSAFQLGVEKIVKRLFLVYRY